ncbi:mCG1027861 [Mus musculus]|nr:mCG1027861 [Mus musculus]
MKADTAFPRLEKGLQIWEAVCNGPKMNFHPACSAALKSKHSNTQMNGKPSPPLPGPLSGVVL